MAVAPTTSPDDGDALALTFAYPVATKAVSAVEEKRGKPEHIGEIRFVVDMIGHEHMKTRARAACHVRQHVLRAAQDAELRVEFLCELQHPIGDRAKLNVDAGSG